MHTLRETGVLARRQLRSTLSSRSGIFVGMMQPVLFLVLFGPIMSRVLDSGDLPGGATAWGLYVPGILVMLALFSAGYAGFDIFADLHSGFQQRLRVTPVSRLSLLTGRITHDVAVQLFQAGLILIASVIFWLDISALAVVVSLLFVVLLTVACASLSYALALYTKVEYTFAPLISLGFLPVMLLSGVLLPMSLAPRWLEIASYFNPFRYVVDGLRAAFRDDFGAREFVVGLAVAIALAVVALAVGTKMFAREHV